MQHQPHLLDRLNDALIRVSMPGMKLWRGLESWLDRLLSRLFAAPDDSFATGQFPTAETQRTQSSSEDLSLRSLRLRGESSVASRLIELNGEIAFDPAAGTLNLLHAGAHLIENASASAAYTCAGEVADLSIAGPGAAFCVRGATLRLSRRDAHLALSWYITLQEPRELWLEARNIGAAPLQMTELRPLDVVADCGGRLNLNAAPRRWSFFQHGWASWTPTFARHLGESIAVVPADEAYCRAHQPHGAPAGDCLSSEWMTVLWGRGGAKSAGHHGLLLGFVTGADQLAEVRLDASAERFAALRAGCHADGVTLKPGQTLRSERLLVQAGDDPLALLEGYADRLGQAMGARPLRCIPTGWCTWYYFFGEGGEKEVLENLNEMRREGLPLDYVIVDDGYQKAIGDWLTLAPEKYSDMAKLADTIGEDGRRAGIWVAPFGLAGDSETYAAHPDWVVHDDAGAPVVGWQHFGQDIYALDLSHPDVAPWLTDVFRTMHADWGYDLFKIDFIFAASAAGRRRDSNMTRAQALRRGLQIIRAAIGDEAFLLGCGAPQAPCVGLVDGMRVGPDVAANWHPFWPDQSQPSVENALRNSIARYFTHGRLWANDPDCVLVRERGDSSALVLNEMRALAGIIALLGGATISSDHLPGLRKGRFKYLAQLLPPTGISARPLDLFENELPECLVLSVSRPWGAWYVVGVMNWQDATRSTEVDLRALGLPAGQYHVFNYWPRNDMGQADQFVTIDRHLPHELVILLLKPVSDQPALLTSTFHIAQTLAEVKSVERTASAAGTVKLTVQLERAGNQSGEVWFAFPPGMKVQSALVDGRKRKVSTAGVGVAHVGLTLGGPAVVEIEFGPAGEEA